MKDLKEKIVEILDNWTKEHFIMDEGDIADQILELIAQEKQKWQEGLREEIKKIKDSKTTEKDLQDLPNLRGIRCAGFSECKRKILNLLKQK